MLSFKITIHQSGKENLFIQPVETVILQIVVLFHRFVFKITINLVSSQQTNPV